MTMTDAAASDDIIEDANETISIAEAARRLGVGKNTAYKAAANGTIPAIRVGGRLLVPLAMLNKMLDPDLPPVARSALSVAGRPGGFLRRFTEDEDNIIKNDYRNYVSVDEIAEKLHRDKGTVRQRILRLDLHRSSIVSKLLLWAPDELRQSLPDMNPEEWIAAVYAWRDQTQQEATAERDAEAEGVHNELLQQAKEIDGRDDMSRNEKMMAKRMLGLTLEEIGAQYRITRERVRQITDPTYVPSPIVRNPAERLERLAVRTARERERIMHDAALQLFKLWSDTPADARDQFLAMIKDELADELKPPVDGEGFSGAS
jgi:excisionase family DNA binding protein